MGTMEYIRLVRGDRGFSFSEIPGDRRRSGTIVSMIFATRHAREKAWIKKIAKLALRQSGLRAFIRYSSASRATIPSRFCQVNAAGIVGSYSYIHLYKHWTIQDDPTARFLSRHASPSNASLNLKRNALL